MMDSESKRTFEDTTGKLYDQINRKKLALAKVKVNFKPQGDHQESAISTVRAYYMREGFAARSTGHSTLPILLR